VRRRILIGTGAAASAAAALLFAGLVRPEPSSGLGTAGRPGAPATGRAAGEDTASLVARLQSQARANPRDVASLGLLALAYEQRARETADPAWYPKAAGVLRRALLIAPRDVTATTALGALALSQHRFREALRIGRRARTLAPSSAAPYGVVGDALLELGRYREAFAAFDEMARIKPSSASYARVAYARELIGATNGARDALLLSRDASVGNDEAVAWAEMQLGKLELARGRYIAAAAHEQAALRVVPGYPNAVDALAQVEAARGNLRRAVALERQAVARVPLPQFVSFLGDALAAGGRRAAARRQYALVGDIDRLLQASGVRTDLELALFHVDHGIRLPQVLARARAARADRPSIDGDDVLAWALARNGRCDEALPWSRRSLRLGTPDTTKLFHRAWIEGCLERDPRAWARRALALNPRFSLLWADDLRRLAR
jgi:tetratricopeptide (TPR) repeat protein